MIFSQLLGGRSVSARGHAYFNRAEVVQMRGGSGSESGFSFLAREIEAGDGWVWGGRSSWGRSTGFHLGTQEVREAVAESVSEETGRTSQGSVCDGLRGGPACELSLGLLGYVRTELIRVCSPVEDVLRAGPWGWKASLMPAALDFIYMPWGSTFSIFQDLLERFQITSSFFLWAFSWKSY